jgi:hypothetical protein
MKRHFAYKLSALLVLVAAIESRAQGDQNAFAGTWKLNVEKSHFDSGPGVREETVTVTTGGMTTIEGVSGSGKPYKHSYAASDGKPVPFNEAKNITVTEITSGGVMERTIHMDGKAVSRQRGVLAKDGNTVSFTVDSTDGQGRPSHEVYFYEKH